MNNKEIKRYLDYDRQIWPWSTKWRRAKANRVLPRECTSHSKNPLPTTREMTLHMDIARLSISKSYWLHSLQPKMEKLYRVSKNKTGIWLWLRSWTPYCKTWTSIKESRENHQPFRYYLNQIPNDYPVEVTNRFKGIDLIDRVPEELWTGVHNIVQESVSKAIPKKNARSQSGCLRKLYK